MISWQLILSVFYFLSFPESLYCLSSSLLELLTNYPIRFFSFPYLLASYPINFLPSLTSWRPSLLVSFPHWPPDSLVCRSPSPHWLVFSPSWFRDAAHISLSVTSWQPIIWVIFYSWPPDSLCCIISLSLTWWQSIISVIPLYNSLTPDSQPCLCLGSFYRTGFPQPFKTRKHFNIAVSTWKS